MQHGRPAASGSRLLWSRPPGKVTGFESAAPPATGPKMAPRRVPEGTDLGGRAPGGGARTPWPSVHSTDINGEGVEQPKGKRRNLAVPHRPAASEWTQCQRDGHRRSARRPPSAHGRGSGGSGTAVCDGDVLDLHRPTVAPQSSGGQRSPRRAGTSSARGRWADRVLRASASEAREKPVSKGTGRAGHLRFRVMRRLD